MARKTGKNKVAVDLQPTPEALKDMGFWRLFAKSLVPKEEDEWHIGEIATMLQENSELIAGHWAKISQVCNKTEGKQINIGMGFKIDRMNTPSTVKGSISYSEKYGENVEKKTPDPKQTELPLTKDEADAAAQEETASAGDAEK
jgi:hypothetical protein